jgi:DNA-binding NarL/FixJ family response regulator
MEKITILIVDDHKLVRESWKLLLDREPDFKVVGTIETGEDAIETAKLLYPDVILLDINMPGMNGLEAVELIRKYSPHSKIIGVSMHTQIAYVRQMMKNGAAGYVTKNSSPQEMIKAIKEVFAGRKYICSEIRNIITGQQLLEENQETKVLSYLSQREMQVIELFQKGHSSREIAVALSISVKTVEAHRYHILRKLNLKNTIMLINFLHKHGITRH